MRSKTFQGREVWETKLPLPLVSRGKVRDIYGIGDERLLIITTDRLSAFDVVLPNPIPDKGRVLNQISLFWFDKFRDLVPNHIITSDMSRMGLGSDVVEKQGPILTGRSMLVHRAKPLPVECVVRGFIAGSGWKDYLKTGAICGHALPPGLKQCQELPVPIFTPATKATEGHDMNITFEDVVRLVGQDTAKEVRDLSITLYKKAVEYARARGIIIADTKFEFGFLGGKLILIDEVLSPDSSRFWPTERYEEGRDQPSFDKQIVRNHLLESGWDQRPPGPELPQRIIQRTSSAYKDVYKRLTGKELS